LTACAGSRYCPLSLWDIKEDMSELPIDDFKTHQISLGFSGCLKGCGRHYHSDIGLIGLRTNLYGETEKAFRIFLGATQSPVAVSSRMLYYSVPLRCSQSLFDVILEDFKLSRYTSFASFSHAVLNRYEIEFLQLWYLFRQSNTAESLLLLNLFLNTSERTKSIELFTEIRRVTDQKEIIAYNELTKILSHQLWDQ
jgi:ferredoxin-nitrite reductase